MTFTPGQNFKRAGDVLIKECTLTSYTGFTIDLKPFFVEAKIYESLFSNCLSGTIFLSESVNLIQHVPIVGMEKLKLVFHTPTAEPITLEMYVYGITDVVQLPGDLSTAYGLNFCSLEQIASNLSKVSKSYKQIPISDIASSIYDVVADENKKVPFYIEPTLGKKSFVIPFWNPFYALNWLSNHARPKNHLDDPTYLFFQTLDGYFFKSINTFFANEPQEVFTYQQENFLRPEGVANPNIAISNIFDYSVVDSSDKLKNSNDGKFASVTYSVDLVTKKYTARKFDYMEDFSKSNHLNENPVLPIKNPFSTSLSSRMMIPKHTYMHNDEENTDERDSIVGRRESFFKQLTTANLEVNIAGDSRRRVGDIIQVLIPSRENIANNPNQPYDVRVSGNYMIASICHSIMNLNYTQRITLSKDSYLTPLPDIKNQETEVSR